MMKMMGAGAKKEAEAADEEPAKPRQSRAFRLSDFDIKDTLGTGTFGRVRLVRHILDDKHYALKVMKKHEIIRTSQLDHIKSEVALLTLIEEHPFIVNLYGHFQDELRLYMVFDFVQGGEVFLHLRNMDRFDDELAKFLAAEITLAFEFLHNKKIVYRDLKPENLLINSAGHVQITDFGFAKVVEDRTWTLCGTPEYLAPEIIQSLGHGKSVDWWALGVLIYEMLAGYPPFYDENPFGIYQKVLDGRFDCPRFFDAKAKDIVKKLLVQDRTKRLGCMATGATAVKSHKWYFKINWSALYKLQAQPPFIPEVAGGEDDTSNFDKYPDSDEGMEEPLDGADAHLFDAFLEITA